MGIGIEEYGEDKLTELIIQCIIKVHRILGPGFLESILEYRNFNKLTFRRQCDNSTTGMVCCTCLETPKVLLPLNP